MSTNFTWHYRAFCDICGSNMIAHKIIGHDDKTLSSVQIFLHCPKCESHLNPSQLEVEEKENHEHKKEM